MCILSAAGAAAGGGIASDGGLQVGVCDWQWAGAGLGAVDVMYLLWTSVEPGIVCEHEAELLRYA